MKNTRPSCILFANAAVFCLLFLFGCSPYHNTPHHGFSPTDVDRFSEDVRIHQGDPEAHYRLGRFFQKRGKHGFAIEEFAKALQIDPAHAKAYNAMGVSFDMTGEYRKAEEAYRMALDLEPLMAVAVNNLGYCFILQGRYEEAIYALENALRLKADSPRFRNNLALAYVKLERFEDAFGEFQKAGGRAYAEMQMARLSIPDRTKDTPAVQISALFSGDDEPPKISAKTPATHPAISEKTPTRTGGLRNGQKPDPAAAPAMLSADDADHVFPVLESPRPVIFKKGSIQTTDLRNGAGPPQENTVTKSMKPLLSVNAEASQSVLPRIAMATPSGTAGGAAAAEEERKPEYRTAALNRRRAENEASIPRIATVFGIEVSNGNGVNGMARQVGDYLKQNGFSVDRLTNADHFGHSDTVIFYLSGSQDDALAVAEQIPGYQNMSRVEGFDRHYIRIKVLIGTDIIEGKKRFLYAAKD